MCSITPDPEKSASQANTTASETIKHDKHHNVSHSTHAQGVKPKVGETGRQRQGGRKRKGSRRKAGRGLRWGFLRPGGREAAVAAERKTREERSVARAPATAAESRKRSPERGGMGEDDAHRTAVRAGSICRTAMSSLTPNGRQRWPIAIPPGCGGTQPSPSAPSREGARAF